MNPDIYIAEFKNKYGDQVTKTGETVRDMNDQELMKRILKRYPGEKDNIIGVEEYLGEKVPGAPKPAVKRRIDEILLDNPLTQGIQQFFPGRKLGEGLGHAAVQIGNLAKGDIDTFMETSKDAPSVPEMAADTANAGLSVLGAALPVAGGIASKVGQSTALGAGMGGTRSIAEGKDIGAVAQDAAVGGAIGAAIPLVGEAIKGLGRLIQGAGDKIQVSVIKPNAADIKDGFSVDTLKKYDLGGSLSQSFQKTEAMMDDLTNQLKGKIEEADPVNLGEVYKKTLRSLTENKAKSFGSNTSVDKALAQLGEEIASVAEDGNVSAVDAQIIKRAAGHMGAWQFGMRDPDSTAREQVYNVFYTKLKNAIEEASPEGVKEVNKQISELIPVLNAIIRRIPVAERNNALSLTDIISLSSAAVDPKGLGVGLLNIASKSGWVGDKLSKMGEGMKQGIPAAGNALRSVLPNASTALPD